MHALNPAPSPSPETLHRPVLLAETLEALSPRPGGRYLDGTLGLGGHAFAVLEAAGAAGAARTGGTGGAELLGLDRDSQAQEFARQRLAPFGAAVHLRQCSFADFETALDELGWDFIDGALVDLGVSSLQLDSPERGFSFLRDGPLDMRMDPDMGLESAASLVNRASVQDLKEIVELYGEEPQAGRVARAIEEARIRKPIEGTLELAGIVERAYPAKWRATARNHPATRVFQALRLVVNKELEQLELFLRRIVPRLAPGGRLAVISFHSLEDRLVKQFFRLESSGCLCPPHILRCVCGHQPSLRLLSKKALVPTDEEINLNPRARSAKLRAAERTENKFSPQDGHELSFAKSSGQKRGRGAKAGPKPGPRSGRFRGLLEAGLFLEASLSREAA